jgi:hypothetical protein
MQPIALSCFSHVFELFKFTRLKDLVVYHMAASTHLLPPGRLASKEDASKFLYDAVEILS